MDIQQTLLDNQSLFSTFSNIFVTFFRFLGWWIIRGLSFLNDSLESALDVIFENLDFFSSADLGLGDGQGGLYSALMPLFWALLTVGIIIVAYLLMTNRLKNKAHIPQNLVLIVVLVLAMPTLLSTLSGITQAAVGAFSSDTSFTEELIQKNVTDLAYLDENNFSADSIANKNNFPLGGAVPVRAIVDPSETMDYSSCSNSELFRSQLKTDANGNISVEKVASKNFFGIDLLDKLYYRYQVNWMVLLVTSIVMLVALLMVGIKTAKYMFEIAFSGIFLMLVSPLDISTGQRTKKIVDEIINLFAAIIMTVILLRIYGIAMSFTSSLPWFPALILQIGFSVVMIGGPNIVQKILGIDVGVGRELQSMAGTMYMAGGAARAIKGGVGAVGSAIKGAGKAGAAAGVMGAAGAGALSSGIKNAAEHFGKKSAGSSEGGYTILSNGSKGSPQGGHPQLDGPANPRIGDGSKNGIDPSDTSGAAAPPDAPIEPSGDSGAGVEPMDVGTGTVTDIDSGNAGVMGKAENGEAPAAKRVTRDDTIGGALGKMAASTKPVRAANAYGEKLSTAFNVGQNTANQAWDRYRSQEPPIPHVYAEEVNFSNSSGSRGYTPEPIIIEDDTAQQRQSSGAPLPPKSTDRLPPKK